MQNLGVPAEEMKKRVEEALKLLDIWQYRDRNPFDLSGGQMQRVAIASVLVMRPDVMILDEPTSQLDPEGSDEVFRAVETLTGSGITILMIEQKIEKLAAYCDRILLLHKGKQIAFDTPQKVFSMPDLNDYGIQAPAFTRICKAEQVTLADGTYPVTVKEAAEVLREKRLGVYEHANAEAGVQKAVGASAAGTGQVQAKNAETGARSGQSGTCRKAENVASVDKQFRIEKLDFSYLADIPVLEDLNMKLDQRPTAIIGQNGAGKTTLVKLLKGLLKPVSGSIYFHGEDISGKTVAMLAGSVGYVFQNPDDQIFKYNVMDEVLFGPLNIGMDPEQAKKEAAWALELTGLSGKEKENPYDLELYERKMTAIASVLAMDTDVLILDEPTASLTPQEIEGLMEIIENLTADGKSVILITHKLKEITASSDNCTIIRQGKYIQTVKVADVDENELAAMMVGRDVNFKVDKKEMEPDEVVLEVKDLHAKDYRGVEILKGFNLNVRKGEIVGLAGVDGNGQTELVEVLTGLRKAESGTVTMLGKDVFNKSPKETFENGISSIPADRQKHGLILDFSNEDNMILQHFEEEPFSSHGFLNRKAIREHAEELIEKFDVRPRGCAEAPAGTLSGGNQQKVIIAREVTNDKDLLIAVNPTRGLDVGAIEFVHKYLVEQRNKNRAVLLVSFELDEIMSLSDRIEVIFDGQITGSVPGKDADEKELGFMMAGGKTDE